MTQPGYPYGYPQSQPPQRSTFRRLLPLWIVLGVLFIGVASCAIALGVSAGGEARKTIDANGNHPEDVHVDSCTADAVGVLTATVTVTNSADRAVAYSVQVAFTAADGAQIATGWAYVSRLGPDLAARQQVFGASAQAAGAQMGCRVLSAQRTALP